MLLKAHFERCSNAAGNAKAAEERLQRLMAVLTERRMAVSFEMVTGAATGIVGGIYTHAYRHGSHTHKIVSGFN